jgi:RimJ/RimL family protein N-acetyltransferase
MRAEVQSGLDEFVAAAWGFLTADEANHTILLGCVQGARRAQAEGREDAGTTPWRSAVASDGEHPIAAALLSRGNWLVSAGSSAALAALGESVRENTGAPAPRGIVGPEPSAVAFAAALGLPTRVHAVLPLMKLVGTPDPGADAAPGRLHPLDENISPEHWQLLLDWSLAFHDEARLTEPREQIKADLRARLPRATRSFWLTPDGAPVCLIGALPIEPTGARIGPVYTPPAFRGRGYARAAVTAACVNLLGRGARSIFLFTDAANPTSNALYRKIGFAPIGRHVHLERAG